MFDSDKTEKPTPRRRQQAREKGQVAKSPDLTSAILLFVSLLLLMSVGKNLAESLFHFSQSLYTQSPHLQSSYLQNNEAFLDSDVFSSQDQLEQLPLFLSQTIFYFLGQFAFFIAMTVLAAIGIHLSQAGWLFLPDKIMPNWENLSLLRGFHRIFSLEGVFRVGIGLFKIFICLIVVSWTFWGQKETILTISQNDSWNIFFIIIDLIYTIAWRVAWALLFLAILDFFYQRWKLENDLRMTPQEIREEMRETIGDPQIIAQRKQRQLRRPER
ncbi:MAG: EscU/YscU/HrcU family type III secretion system export apparatus switch protein [Planctomycetia bacterium]|nr:EscU/YscU/HrcU family type III secretion system export apparatus switch protein [Planctomycetia bacterium]